MRNQPESVLVLAEGVMRRVLGSGHQLYLLSSYQVLDLTGLDVIDRSVVALCPKTPFIPLFSSSLKEIGAQAFAGTMVQRLWLPESVKTIGYGAFSDCVQLLDADLPGVTYVAEMAFFGCKKLTYASIGAVKYIADSAFADCGLSELHIARPKNYVQAMVGWPFGTTASRIKTLPDASPFLYLAWDSDRHLLREILGNTHSQMYATSAEFEPVVDFSECAVLTNSLVRSRVGNVDRRIKPVFGRSLSAIVDGGFSWHTGIEELKDLQQVKVLGTRAFEGTKTQVPCDFGCQVLSAEALYGFTQQTVTLSDCWLGEHAVWNGPAIELCGAVSAENYSLEGLSVTLLSGFKLSEMTFGCKDGLSAGNSYATLCAYWDELEADDAWPFGLKLENVTAIEREVESGLCLAPEAKLRRLRNGQIYCKRTSDICDVTYATAFTKSTLAALVRRYGQLWTKPTDLIFSDKLTYIAPDAFDACQVKPTLHC